MRMRCALGSRCSEREGKIEGGERSGCCLSSGTIEWTAWARDHVSLWLVSKPRDSIPAAGNRQHARPGPTERDRLAETGYFWGAGVTFFVSFPLIAVCFFFFPLLHPLRLGSHGDSVGMMTLSLFLFWLTRFVAQDSPNALSQFGSDHEIRTLAASEKLRSLEIDETCPCDRRHRRLRRLDSLLLATPVQGAAASALSLLQRGLDLPSGSQPSWWGPVPSNPPFPC